MSKEKQIAEMTKDICCVQHNCNNVCNPVGSCDALRYAERAIEAGYVKVVRCKDCKHYRDWGGCTTCMFWSVDYDVATEPNAFCSFGEKKDGKEQEI